MSCGTARGAGADYSALPQAFAPTVVAAPLLEPAHDPQAHAGAASHNEDGFGERRFATVAFSDMTGYTAMTERLDPETVDDLMGTIKARAHEIVAEHGGIVNQFVGDEIVALFGVPFSQGRDASAAVRATQAIHAMVDAVSAAHAETLGVQLRLHSGICSGVVVVTKRDARNGTYTVVGDTMNTAARLVSVAGPDEIVLAPKTRAAVVDEFELAALEPIRLKGKEKPFVPYRLIREHGPEPTRWRGSTTPFANRVIELRMLTDLATRARSGLVTAVVSGEAGIGKSRLLYEFLRRMPTDSMTIMRGHGHASGSRTPFLPWREVLRSVFDITEMQEPQDAAHLVSARIHEDQELRDHCGALLHVMALPSVDACAVPAGTAGPELQRRMWDAIFAALHYACRERVGVVVIDDWQFADGASKEVLLEIVRDMRDTRLAIVLCQAGTTHVDADISIPLGDLEIDATITILASLFGVEHVAPELAEAVFERTDGNPLFIEETALAMIEDGSISVEGTARLSVRIEDLALPANVHAALLQRLDRLAPVERELTRFAAVIGREFSVTVLERLVPGVDTRAALIGLVAAGLIVATGSDRYIFTHGIMQDVAYQTLLRRTRKSMHAEVGRAIEEIYAGSLADHFEELAFHYRHSGDNERAIHFGEAAGDKAADGYALSDARRQFHDAYERLGELPALERDAVTAERLAIKWASVSVFAPVPEQITALESALETARARGADDAVHRITYWIGRLDYAFGRYDAAIARFERVTEFQDDPDLAARASAVLGRAMLFTAEPERGTRLLERAIAILGPRQMPDEIAYSTSSLACLNALLGDFVLSEEQYARALRSARNHNNRSIESLVLQQHGWARALRGDWHGARNILERCASLAERTGNHVLHAFADVFSAYATAFDGDASAAYAHMRDGLERYVATGAKLAASMVYGWAAEVFARNGDMQRAQESAHAALERGADGDRFGRIAAQRALLAVRAAAGDAAGVATLLGDIETFGNAHELRTDLALAMFAHAAALRELGDPQADARFAYAAQRFAAIGMTWFEAAARARQTEGAIT